MHTNVALTEGFFISIAAPWLCGCLLASTPAVRAIEAADIPAEAQAVLDWAGVAYGDAAPSGREASVRISGASCACRTARSVASIHA
jgi:hypothetical protein